MHIHVAFQIPFRASSCRCSWVIAAKPTCIAKGLQSPLSAWSSADGSNDVPRKYHQEKGGDEIVHVEMRSEHLLKHLLAHEDALVELSLMSEATHKSAAFKGSKDFLLCGAPNLLDPAGCVALARSISER